METTKLTSKKSSVFEICRTILTSKKSSVFEICRTIPYKDILQPTFDKKGSYIPWADAWMRFKEYFPDADFQIISYIDDTVGSTPLPYLKTEIGFFVGIEVTADQTKHSILFPVMGANGTAIKDPDARDISDNQMRALVKCLALMGFGIECWQKDAPPPAFSKPEPRRPIVENITPAQNILTSPQAGSIYEYKIDLGNSTNVAVYKGKTLSEVPENWIKGQLDFWKRKTDLESDSKPAVFIQHAEAFFKKKELEKMKEPKKQLDLSDIPF